MVDFKIICEEYDFCSLAKVFGGEAEADCPLSVEVVFADKPGIKKLNAQFRNNDSVTDVLSFPTLDGVCGKIISAQDFPYDTDESGTLFLGSIVICKDVAKEQAEEYGHSFERELFYLATHGVCHLLGYDHMTESDKALMREKEERVLKKLNLTRDE